MTTYRAISDTEVAVDAPLTQQLVQALKDNVLAIAEGDSTAPNGGRPVSLQAVDTDAVTSNTNGATTSTFVGLSVARLVVSGSRAANNNYDRYSPYITIYRGGTYTCHLTANGQDGDIRIACELYINDVYVTETAGAVTPNTYLHHVVTLAEGDTIRIRNHRTDGDNIGQTLVRLDLVCDNPLTNTKPASYARTFYTSNQGATSTGLSLWT